MNQLIVASVSGIKCTPLTRMLRLVQARSFVNSMVSELPAVGNSLGMDETGGEKEIDFLLISNKEMHTSSSGSTGIYYGPVFTGEVEKRYLDYLGKFDWESLQRHMIDFPRRRSENEVRFIFDKWAAHFGRKYPSPELKEMRFPEFKRALASLDDANSFKKDLAANSFCGPFEAELCDKSDIEDYPVSCYVYGGRDYRVKRFRIRYHSYTPLSFCELSDSYAESYIVAGPYGDIEVGYLYDDSVG